MRKLVVITGVVLFLLMGIGALALLNLNGFIERNKIALLARAEKALGRKAAVGEVGVTLWGGIGVRLKDFALADDPAFSPEDFLRADDLQVNVRLLPLLWRELRVTRFILHKPVITIVRDARGRYNFASLGGGGEKAEGAQGGTAREGGPRQAMALLASLVDVTDGEIHYLDRGAGVDLRASRTDLRLQDLGMDRPVSVRIAAAALGANEKNLKIEGVLGPLRAGEPLDRAPVKGDIEIGPLTVEALARAVPLAGLLPAGLAVDGPLSLKAHAEGTAHDLALKGTLEATSSAVTWGDRLTKAKGVPLVLSVEARATDPTIALSKATMRLHTLEVAGGGEIGRGTPSSLRLTLDSGRQKLDGWEKILPALRDFGLSGEMELHARVQGAMGKGKMPQINGTLVLASVRASLPSLPKPVTDLNAKLLFTGDRAELPETVVRLGDSQIRLAAQVQRFVPLAVSYRLSAPELRPADVRAGGLGGQKPEVLREVRGEGRIGAGNGALSAQGRLSSARGTIRDLDYTDLQTTVSLADRVIGIEGLTLRTLDGSLQGSGRYDPRGASPRFTFASRGQGLDLPPLLRALVPAASPNLRGKATFDLRLAASGKQWEDIRRTLEEQGQAEIVKGALADVNIAERVLSGVTGIAGVSGLASPRVREKYPDLFGTRDTRFDQAKGSMTIHEGKVRTDDLIIAAADFAARGGGWIGLDGTVDANAVLSLSKRLTDDIAKEVKEAKLLSTEQGRLEIPFRLVGSLPQVKAQPDLASLGRRLLRQGVLQKGEEELQKRLPKGLFRQEGASPPAEPREKSPQEQLRKGLERFFGK